MTYDRQFDHVTPTSTFVLIQMLNFVPFRSTGFFDDLCIKKLLKCENYKYENSGIELETYHYINAVTD